MSRRAIRESAGIPSHAHIGLHIFFSITSIVLWTPPPPLRPSKYNFSFIITFKRPERVIQWEDEFTQDVPFPISLSSFVFSLFYYFHHSIVHRPPSITMAIAAGDTSYLITLYLQITMNDSLLVHVVDGLQDLSHQISCILFSVRSLLDDAIEQLTTCHST